MTNLTFNNECGCYFLASLDCICSSLARAGLYPLDWRAKVEMLPK